MNNDKFQTIENNEAEENNLTSEFNESDDNSVASKSENNEFDDLIQVTYVEPLDVLITEGKIFYPPSDNQVRFIRTIERLLKLTAPQEIFNNKILASSFIDAHKDKLPPMEIKPPSESQVWFAHIIEKHSNICIPNICYENKRAMSAWISDHVGLIPPTEKHLEYAMSIAIEEFGPDGKIPEVTKRSKQLLDEWIDIVKEAKKNAELNENRPYLNKKGIVT